MHPVLAAIAEDAVAAHSSATDEEKLDQKGVDQVSDS